MKVKSVSFFCSFAGGAGAFFLQERPGLHGRIFKIIKFKTMTDERDAEGKEITEYLSTLSRFKVCCTKVQIVNSPTSPYFMMVETK